MSAETGQFGIVEGGFRRVRDKGEGEFVSAQNGNYSFVRISREVPCPETGSACMDFIHTSFWKEGVRIDSLHITENDVVVRMRAVYDRPDRIMEELPLLDPKDMIESIDRFDKVR